MPPPRKTSFVEKLSTEQMEILRALLLERSWELRDAEYCHFQAKKEKTSVAAYLSGKLVIQGAGAADFMEFILEPLVLKECREPEKEVPPEPFFPHGGIDESGKGDFFGPLVIACAFTGTQAQSDELREIGVRDSKLIKNDAVIEKTALRIRAVLQGKFGVVAIGPEAYNRMYERIGNLNKLLAWGHARALENMLGEAPECTMAIADQFGDEHFIRDALLAHGRSIELRQRTKAESDIAVAAASILARAEFVRRIRALEQACGHALPKGASAAVDATAKTIASEGGADALGKVAKMHFRTAYRALGLPEPEHREWRKR